jgi:hypothetical protein
MGDGALTKAQLDEFAAAWRADCAAAGYVDTLAPVAKGLSEVKVRDRAVIEACMRAVAPVIHALEQRVAELEARPALKYLGTWKQDKTYSAGTFITDAGAVWYCNASTTSRPGENADWSLAVKSGGVPTSSPRPDAAATASPRNGNAASNPRLR